MASIPEQSVPRVSRVAEARLWLCLGLAVGVGGRPTHALMNVPRLVSVVRRCLGAAVVMWNAGAWGSVVCLLVLE
jgi:hypothetical protein